MLGDVNGSGSQGLAELSSEKKKLTLILLFSEYALFVTAGNQSKSEQLRPHGQMRAIQTESIFQCKKPRFSNVHFKWPFR